MLTIDLKNRTAVRDNIVLIKNGTAVGNYVIDPTPVTFEQLENLYAQYKHSVPNGIRYKFSYFKALSADELKDTDLIAGSNRTKAKEMLEMTLLSGILNGSLRWPDENHWFWQSETDSDFVILKEWFGGNDHDN